MNRQGWALALQALLGLAYPFLIWTGLSRFEPRSVGLFVLAFFALRLALRQPGRLRAALRSFGRPALVIGLIMAAVIGWNDARGLFLLPVAISLGFLATFLGSLRNGPPMIERFARLQVDTLSSAEVRYCRRVTWVWCGFFVLNASVAGALALWGSTRSWALYTGLLSYIAMGTLFAAEYIYRHARFRRYEGGFADPLLKKIFPPSAAWAPTVISRRALTSGWEVEWQVPEALDCFAGHFPEQALLPGVLQLEWLAREIERAPREGPPGQAGPSAFSRIERLKFKRPILPGDRLTASFETGAGADDAAVKTTFPARGEAVVKTTLPVRGEPVVKTTLPVRGEAVVKTTLRVRGEVATTANWIRGGAGAPPADARDAVANAGEPHAAPAAEEPEHGTEWHAESNTAEVAMEELLPHRSPMLWLDRIEHFDAASARCLARASTLRDGLGSAGAVGGWAALEWMAQAVAAHDGAKRRLANRPIRPGMLLGTPRLELAAEAIAFDESAWVDVRRVLGDDESSMVVYEARVRRRSDGQTRAAARISCRIGSPGEPLVSE